MAFRHNPHSFSTYDFGWTASGSTTFVHNMAFPLRHTEYPYNIEIDEGDAYISTKGTSSFTLVAATTTGYCHLEPWIDPNDTQPIGAKQAGHSGV